MSFLNRSFAHGFGSVLTLQPSELRDVSQLRRDALPGRVAWSPLIRARFRDAEAETIRKAIRHVTISSAKFEQQVKEFSKNGIPQIRSGAIASNGALDSASFDHKDLNDSMQLELYRKKDGPEEGAFFSVFTDGIRALSNMLAIREDWERISCDLASADETTPKNS